MGDPGFLESEDTHESLAVTPTSVSEIASEPEACAMLMALSGDDAGKTFVLDRKEMLIGRAVDAQIRLSTVQVSRRHALIVPTAQGGFLLRDLGSRNGTKV